MMIFILVFAVGVVFGVAGGAFWFGQRFRVQVQGINQSLQELTALHQNEVQENKALKQQVADLNFALNQTNNELTALKK